MRKVIATRAVSDEFDTVILVAGSGLRIVAVTGGASGATQIGETYVVHGQYRDADAVEAAISAEWT